MTAFKNYRERGSMQSMRPHIPGESMDGISVSNADKHRLEEPGGMIAARNGECWYVPKEVFESMYEPKHHE